MAIWILAGVLAAAVLGFPVVPVLALGAFAMCATAFCLTRNARILRTGLGLGLFAASQIMLKEVLLKGIEDLPRWGAWVVSDTTLAAFSCLVMLVAMLDGMRGPVREVPLTPDGVLKVVRDAEQREPKDLPDA